MLIENIEHAQELKEKIRYLKRALQDCQGHCDVTIETLNSKIALLSPDAAPDAQERAKYARHFITNAGGKKIIADMIQAEISQVELDLQKIL